MEIETRYPIGQQDFKVLRERHSIYIDKTQYVRKIVDDGGQYFFLARPRRFGKSLFLSTLRYFFEGRRDLFEGLYIHSTDWDWEQYPVLYLDLNTDKYVEPGVLDEVLDYVFRIWEERYEVDVKDTMYSLRLKAIIENAHLKTGKPVVILVDEYDKPLVGNLNNEENFEIYRRKLASIYSNFKSSAEHIRLVFLTGVSRFSKLSVFSDLNNLNDISFDDVFADICGITEKELLDNFREGIDSLSTKRKESYSETCLMLKRNYDGYRFAPEGSDIYNPWSVLNCLSKGRIGAFWTATGSTSVIAEALYDADIDIEQTLNARWRLDRLVGLDLRNANPTALLYQAGYLTISEYDFRRDTVKLKVPNEEVKEGLFNDLLHFYVKVRRGNVESVVTSLSEAILNGKPENMMKQLDAYFSGIPYDLKMDNENNFQNAFDILITLIGFYAKAEIHTSDGRIDLLIETSKYLYLIELKYDSSAENAISQIKQKEYYRQFHRDGRKLFMIGVNFSSKKRRIESWEISYS